MMMCCSAVQTVSVPRCWECCKKVVVDAREENIQFQVEEFRVHIRAGPGGI
jgi:hypothetical protein